MITRLARIRALLPTLPSVVRRPARRLRLVGWLLILLGTAYCCYVYLGPNLHTVIRDRVYRANQPSAAGLKSIIESGGIRTVINLRGYSPDPAANHWYADEVQTNFEHDVSQEDVTWSAYVLPYPNELRRLIEIFDRTEYPVLVHCKQGSDRTGVAAGVALLLYTDASVFEAKQQLWPIYGHWPVSRTLAMDDFFTRYEHWLTDNALSHTPNTFRDWALNHYRDGPTFGTLVLKNAVEQSVFATANRWHAIDVVATNTAKEPWKLEPGAMAGVHVTYLVQNDRGETVTKGQAGLLRASVAPGTSIQLTLAVKPLPPGRYTLRADLQDASGAAVANRAVPFYKFGNDPLMVLYTVEAGNP